MPSERPTLPLTKGMFGWVDFREDGKKIVESTRENEWEWCLVEKGSGREKWWSPAVFFPGSPKFNPSKMGRKWRN